MHFHTRVYSGERTERPRVPATRRSLRVRARRVVVNHCRRRQLPMGGVEFDQLQKCPLHRRQRRLFRQESVAHAAEQLLQLRGQLRVQILADAREDEEQAIRLRIFRTARSNLSFRRWSLHVCLANFNIRVSVLSFNSSKISLRFTSASELMTGGCRQSWQHFQSSVRRTRPGGTPSCCIFSCSCRRFNCNYATIRNYAYDHDFEHEYYLVIPGNTSH